MAKVVKKLVISPFMLKKAIGQTLHASQFQFDIMFSFPWAAGRSDQYLTLPAGITMPDGYKYAWKSYTYETNTNVKASVVWNHIGLSEAEYKRVKEEERKAEENNKPSEEEEPEEDADIYNEIEDTYTFDPDFIKPPASDTKPTEFS